MGPSWSTVTMGTNFELCAAVVVGVAGQERKSVMDIAKLISVTEKTSGRDKLCRLVQYGSKFVYWMLEQESLNPDLIVKLKDLENSISTARKLFRLGTSVNQFKVALQTIHLDDPLQQFLITLNKISRGFYLILDHFIWANRMKLINIQSKYWSRLSNQFWLFAIFLGLVRDVYEILKYQKDRSLNCKTVCATLSKNPAVCVDLVKNCGDFFIPLSRLDVVYLPDGVVGLLGVISSMAGLVAMYNDRLKLKFS